MFHKLFLDPSSDFSALDQPRSRYLYDVDSFRTFVNESIANYYAINGKTMDFYEYDLDNAGKIIKPRVQMFFMDSAQVNQSMANEFPIGKDDMEVFEENRFDNEKVKALLGIITKIEIVYTLKNKFIAEHA